MLHKLPLTHRNQHPAQFSLHVRVCITSGVHDLLETDNSKLGTENWNQQMETGNPEANTETQKWKLGLRGPNTSKLGAKKCKLEPANLKLASKKWKLESKS